MRILFKHSVETEALCIIPNPQHFSVRGKCCSNHLQKWSDSNGNKIKNVFTIESAFVGHYSGCKVYRVLYLETGGVYVRHVIHCDKNRADREGTALCSSKKADD